MRQLPWSYVLAAAVLTCGAGRAADDGWVSLFNGMDLTGWETSLGTPVGGKAPIGRGRDPKGIFKVARIDGEPAIRISGEILGGLTTLKGYGNYHLELEFKWGEQRFAPRLREPRDSGLLYHGVNGYNPGSGWIESLEFGILEGGETGDFWSVPGSSGQQRILVDMESEDVPVKKRRYPQQPFKYRPGGKKVVGTNDGLLNSDDNEKPRGKWNKLELYCVGTTSAHVTNGTVNLVLTNARRKIGDKEEPLSRGRLQLQSEGAEVYFRRLRLRPIKAFPAEVLRAMKAPPPNTLTAEEKAAGWRLLFDGETTKGWRGYRQKEVPAGWQAKDGALVRVAKAGDLITKEKFGDFELSLEWKVSHGSNSGIFYRATEDGKMIWESGPEYEIRDSAFWTENPYTNGANYALHPPTKDAARPVGYWNHARIVARGDKVEHWLNGEKVAAYELHSDDWKERVKKSTVRGWKGYGKARSGHIGLQDYNDLLWFRNIKIRPLKDE